MHINNQECKNRERYFNTLSLDWMRTAQNMLRLDYSAEGGFKRGKWGEIKPPFQLRSSCGFFCSESEQHVICDLWVKSISTF